MISTDSLAVSLLTSADSASLCALLSFSVCFSGAFSEGLSMSSNGSEFSTSVVALGDISMPFIAAASKNSDSSLSEANSFCSSSPSEDFTSQVLSTSTSLSSDCVSLSEMLLSSAMSG